MSVKDTGERILDAALVALTRHGQRRLSMSAIAEEAGVSRPTLYRYYATKGQLLDALAAHEQRRFDEGLAAALAPARTREQRLDAALRWLIVHPEHRHGRALVDAEPRFMLERLRRGLRPQSIAFERTVGDALASAPAVRSGAITTGDLAELVVRVAMSNFLLPPVDHEAALATLRAMVGVRARAA